MNDLSVPAMPYCPICRVKLVHHRNDVCPGCSDKAKTHRLDNVAERAAVECYAQLTRFVQRGELTAECAARSAWDWAVVFREETARRMSGA